MEDKTLGITLKFALAEEAAAKKAAANITDLAKKFDTLQKEADETRKGIAKALEQGENADGLKKKLVEVQSELSKTSAKALELQRKMESAKWESVQKLGQGLQNVGDKVGQIGSAMSAVGAIGFGAIFASAQKFVNESPLDEVSQRWVSSQKEMEQSFLRIGRVAADELLPLMEKFADMAEDTAAFIEKNPELIKALVGITGGLAIGGATLQGASTVMKVGGAAADLFGKAGLALGGAGAAGAAGAAGTAAGAGAGAAGSALAVGGAVVLGGALAGGGIYDNLIAGEGSGRDKSGTILGKTASVAAYGLGNLFGGEDMAKEWYKAMGEMTGVIEKQADAAKNYSENVVTSDMLAAFDAYEKAGDAIVTFEKESGEARAALVEQSAAERVAIEARAEEARIQTIQRYATARADAEVDYYKSRADVARQYNVDIQRAEQDHQRKMQQLLLGHSRRVLELVDERDALGLKREIQSYEDQRREEEAGFNIEMSRKNEDYAAQIAQMESQFRLQQDRRARDFDQQLVEMDARQAQELAKFDQQTAEKLAKLDEQNAKELKALEENEKRRMNTLRSVALGDNAALQQETAVMTAKYKQWLEAASRGLSLPVYGVPGGLVGPPAPARALGGPVNAGMTYLVGERGPELFKAPRSGEIFPNGMTADLLNPRQRSAGGNRTMQMRVETSSLTMTEVLAEVDRRFSAYDNAMAAAYQN